MGLRKRVVFIHFQPLELYPPVMNMIDYVGCDKKIELYVLTNRKSRANQLSEYTAPPGVKIFRPAIINGNALRRYFNYGFFYLFSFIKLIQLKPSSVLYFETLSSWPGLVYKRIFKSINLMAHYHEYSGPKEYAKNMVLAKWMHRIERKMYHSFSWISQTNSERMKMFKDDNQLNLISESIFHIIPNYPPKSWLNARANDFSKNKIKRLVFVGSLGYENMYLQEVIDWLGHHRDEFSLDIYSYNIDAKAKDVLEKCELKNIQYFGGCDYSELPQVLLNYDIGLDLYKPFALNHIHGVSNKIFEYLACGLDVWFSSDKPQTAAYIRTGYFPKVIPVDFNYLDTFDYKEAISHTGLQLKPSPFFYENVYPELISHFIN